MPRRPRVALATFAGMPDLHEDDVPLLPAFAAAGVDASAQVWDDPAVDWSSFDLVVLRSPWDYTLRHEQFLAWARSVPRLANPADVLAWNTDKRYLAELAAAGVPVVPTTWLAPGDDYTPPAGEHVVKPVISAGARDTGRYPAGADSTAHAQALLAEGRHVMVQPYLAAVDTEGETSLLWFDGAFSHAARKAPVLVPDLADPDEVEITARVATPAQLALAEAALAAVPLEGTLLYARVDLLPGDDGAPVLIELELAEPSLFFLTAPEAVDRFVRAVVRRAGG